MNFDTPLVRGTLLRRYKRFLADVELPSGDVVVCHTANTGSMLGCATAGDSVWMTHHNNPKRKTQYTWEITQTQHNEWIGVNTSKPTSLVLEAIDAGLVADFADFDHCQTEVTYGAERSRIDILLSDARKGQCFVELKNVTAKINGIAVFPDAVSSRASKHMRELQRMVEQGHRAAVVFCIQRADVTHFAPAEHIDPVYANTLKQAVDAGVEIYALKAKVDDTQIVLTESVMMDHACIRHFE